MTSKRSIDWFLESSSGMKLFHLSVQVFHTRARNSPVYTVYTMPSWKYASLCSLFVIAQEPRFSSLMSLTLFSKVSCLSPLIWSRGFSRMFHINTPWVTIYSLTNFFYAKNERYYVTFVFGYTCYRSNLNSGKFLTKVGKIYQLIIKIYLCHKYVWTIKVCAVLQNMLLLLFFFFLFFFNLLTSPCTQGVIRWFEFNR